MQRRVMLQTMRGANVLVKGLLDDLMSSDDEDVGMKGKNQVLLLQGTGKTKILCYDVLWMMASENERRNPRLQLARLRPDR
jgi:hypothetical protein